VAQGELDQCGGHAGQGEDYHYHDAPVCLLENQELRQPIAFSLDGAPIYYGTGGTDYYGGGRFNDWNNLPEGSAETLDFCNAYQQSDDSFAYHTTAEQPYVLGCHRGDFDRSQQRNIRFSGRLKGTAVPFGTEAGEPFNTTIYDFVVESDGKRTILFEGNSGTAKWTFVQTDIENDCWEFVFLRAMTIRREQQRHTAAEKVSIQNVFSTVG